MIWGGAGKSGGKTQVLLAWGKKSTHQQDIQRNGCTPINGDYLIVMLQ